ncbi:SU10 major capsid protein [Paenibacillus naphthalenovorans]|uniref:SU10 major capsid protein n=1 Tax=Paenibacillus naphthalenovorans TaxID=162209 RepID=UPI003D2C8B1E
MPKIYNADLIGKKLSVVDEILLLNPHQTPLINLLGFSDAVTQINHQWFEDEIFGDESSVVGAKLATDTSVVVANAEPFRVGHVIKIGDELLYVSAINAGTKTLTITRGYAGTTAAAIADGAKVEVQFVEGTEGADARAARYKARTSASNYTQIFDDSIEVTGTAEAVTQYGISDLYEYEKQKKQIELALSLEKALINGIAYQSGNVRQMRGIRSFIQTNVIDAAGAAVDGNRLNDALQLVYEKGGFASGGNYKIMVAAKQKRAISALDANKIQITQSENSRGQVVDMFVSDFGQFEIVLNNNLDSKEIIIMDANRAKIRPLVGRDFFHKYMGEQGDYTRGILVGEYTLEFLQEKAHARIKGLA